MAKKKILMPSQILGKKQPRTGLSDESIESILAQSHGEDNAQPASAPKPDTTGQVDSKSGIFKKLPGKTLYGERLSVPADQTMIYGQNTRNYESNHSLSESLLDSIRLNGGNAIPAEGRRLPDGTIEVLAGTQRRFACIQENVPLTIDVYADVSDDDAHYIAFIENHGRTDITFVAQCHYFRTRFDALVDDGETIERFTSRYKLQKSTMKEYLSYGLIPSELTSKVAKQELFSARNMKQLRSVWSDISKDKPELEASMLIEILVKDARFSTPKELIEHLRQYSNSKPKIEKDKLEINSRSMSGTMTKRNNKINLSVTCKEIDPDVLEQRLRELIESL